MRIKYGNLSSVRNGIEGVGVVKQQRLLSQRWTFTLQDGSTFEMRRNWGPRWRITISDSAGLEIGSYQQKRLLLGGGPIRFAERELRLATAKRATPLFDVFDDQQRIVRVGGVQGGADMTVEESANLEPGLLLFLGWLASAYAIAGNGASRIFNTSIIGGG